MFAALRRWIARAFGHEEERRELFDLARQATAAPENERLILRLGDCYLRGGDKERALSAYWHVVDLYKKRSDWLKASAVLKRIALLAQHEVVARFELAQCFEKLERRREAAEQWELAARVLEEKHDVAGAVRCYTRASALDPKAKHLAHHIARLAPKPQLAPLPQLDPLPKLAPIPRLAPLPKLAPMPKLEPIPEVWPMPEQLTEEQVQVKPDLASLGRAQVRHEIMEATLHDDPLDAFDLGIADKATSEYSPEELATLLDGDFEAETVAVGTLAPASDEHGPAAIAPANPLILSP